MDSPRHPKRLNILIVDDDQLVRDFAVNTVAFHTNRPVITLESGFDGWQYLQQQGRDIDMVIADATIPDMDGLELLALVKRNDPRKIFILTSSNAAHERTAVHLNADAFLAKPYDVQDLLRVIQELVRQTEPRPTSAPTTI